MFNKFIVNLLLFSFFQVSLFAQAYSELFYTADLLEEHVVQLKSNWKYQDLVVTSIDATSGGNPTFTFDYYNFKSSPPQMTGYFNINGKLCNDLDIKIFFSIDVYKGGNVKHGVYGGREELSVCTQKLMGVCFWSKEISISDFYTKNGGIIIKEDPVLRDRFNEVFKDKNSNVAVISESRNNSTITKENSSKTIEEIQAYDTCELTQKIQDILSKE